MFSVSVVFYIFSEAYEKVSGCPADRGGLAWLRLESRQGWRYQSDRDRQFGGNAPGHLDARIPDTSCSVLAKTVAETKLDELL
jgi:hypothetical protein